MKRVWLGNGLFVAAFSKALGGTLLRFDDPIDWSRVEFEVLRLRSLGTEWLKVIGRAHHREFIDRLADRHHITFATVRLFDGSDEREIQFFQDTGRLRLESKASAAIEPQSVTPLRVGSATPIAEIAEGETVRVLIVDDSKSMRMVLKKILEEDSRIKVIGEADRPSAAIEFLRRKGALKPDAMTLDIQMPEMSGVEFFKKHNAEFRIPTVMVSALGLNEGHEVMNALEAGAFDYFQKPDSTNLAVQAPFLQEKVLQAARFGRKKIREKQAGIARHSVRLAETELLAVGSSTGGTEAVRSIFELFTADTPPIVVVQHIPPFFSAAFADRLNKICAFEVREARDGDELRKGLALVAAGGYQLEVERRAGKLIARVIDAEPVNRFKPSVDVLFRSVAKVVGPKATGLILTGMGADGARGLLEMRQAGARTLGQSEDTCVVYGMPRAAAEMGAVGEVVALDAVASALAVGPTLAVPRAKSQKPPQTA